MVGQKGVAQIFVIIILIVGLFGGLFLVQQTQIFKPRAQVLVSAPINICTSRIINFSVNEPCDDVNNGFRSVKFLCETQMEDSDLNRQGGDSNVCRTIQDWVRIAEKACSQLCGLTSLPVPAPSGEPVCPAEFPRCEGELIEVSNSGGCSRYICINQIQIPTIQPIQPQPVSCKPWEKIYSEGNVCQPIWEFRRNSFSGVSASLAGNQAEFDFEYSGVSETLFKVHMAKEPDFTDPIYWSFAAGESSPLINNAPGQTWDQYACGETFYWKVEAVRGAVMSDVQKAQVHCDD